MFRFSCTLFDTLNIFDDASYDNCQSLFLHNLSFSNIYRFIFLNRFSITHFIGLLALIFHFELYLLLLNSKRLSVLLHVFLLGYFENFPNRNSAVDGFCINGFFFAFVHCAARSCSDTRRYSPCSMQPMQPPCRSPSL